MKQWISLVAMAMFTLGIAGITGCEQETSLEPNLQGVENAARDAANATEDAASDAADAARDAVDDSGM